MGGLDLRLWAEEESDERGDIVFVYSNRSLNISTATYLQQDVYRCAELHGLEVKWITPKL